MWGENTMSNLFEPVYIVLDEDTLGYVQPISPNIIGVLAGKHNWINGPTASGRKYVRAATESDFDKFRCYAPSNYIPASDTQLNNCFTW
jgi:hypothetical protein